MSCCDLFLDVDDYGQYVVEKAKRKLLYKSNDIEGEKFTAILYDYFDDACKIIRDWRRLKDDEEIMSGKWEREIVDFIVNSYMTMGDTTLNSISVNGVNKNYRISPEGQLKSSIPQII